MKREGPPWIESGMRRRPDLDRDGMEAYEPTQVRVQAPESVVVLGHHLVQVEITGPRPEDRTVIEIDVVGAARLTMRAAPVLAVRE